jgi:hypothetical protein
MLPDSKILLPNTGAACTAMLVWGALVRMHSGVALVRACKHGQDCQCHYLMATAALLKP